MKRFFVIGMGIFITFFIVTSTSAQDDAMVITPEGNVEVNRDLHVEGNLSSTNLTTNNVDGTRLYRWYSVADPITNWAFTKSSGWTADSFSGGLTCNFTGKVTPGTKAIKCTVMMIPKSGGKYTTFLFWRKNGDPAISNTPYASKEFANMVGNAFNESAYQYWENEVWIHRVEIWLDDNYTAQFAVTQPYVTLYVSNPVAEYR